MLKTSYKLLNKNLNTGTLKKKGIGDGRTQKDKYFTNYLLNKGEAEIGWLSFIGYIILKGYKIL